MSKNANEMHTLGVLASGSGSNFEAIDDAIRGGRLKHARIGVVISDQRKAGVLLKARARQIPAVWLGEVNKDQRNDLMLEKFHEYGVDLGVAAGYLRLVGARLLEYCDVLNIHPAPLPRFGGPGLYGLKAHQAVIDAGEKWGGPTVHLMNQDFDKGQILAHVQVPVVAGDTAEDLAARTLPYEHDLFWRVIGQQLRRGPHPDKPERHDKLKGEWA